MDIPYPMNSFKIFWNNADQTMSASKFLLDHLGDLKPKTAIVLGSGLIIDVDAIHCQFSASDIPGFIVPTVEGHKGQVTAGVFADHEILIMQGRVHYYEGVSSGDITFQVRLAHQLNIRNIIFLSAAGGIRRSLDRGSIMLVKDHICAHPLHATLRHASVYDGPWRKRILSVCTNPLISCGMYVWTLGPSYETPAEIIAFERRGGDAVGMSLVPEALEASALGMSVLAVAVITNPAAGLGDHCLSHDGVLHAAGHAQDHLAGLLTIALDQSSSSDSST